MNSIASGGVDHQRFSPAAKEGLPYSHRPPTPPHVSSLTTSASPPRSPRAHNDRADKHATELVATHIPNGHNSPVSHYAQDESEAETVVLSGSETGGIKRKNKLIKHESEGRGEKEVGDVSSSQVAGVTQRAKSAETRTGPLVAAQISASPQNTAQKSNGIERPADGGNSRYSGSPSPPTTSPSNREPSQKSASPEIQQVSPSPSRTTSTRQRSASTTDSRKRKRNEEAPQPPRQKLKTTQPASPDLKVHKRSASSQSALGLRKSKDRQSDSSSDASSPQPQQERTLATQQPRLKRLIYRSATSPARSMPHKKNVDRFGATRLARECEKGDLKAVQAAYEAAPDELDQQDYAGITPLQKAALNGFPDIVEFLIAKGCRTDCQNSDRDTPLIDAVENGHLEVVKILLDVARVNPHHQNKQGQRALDVLREDVDDAEEIEKELRKAMQRESNGTDDSARDIAASQEASSTNLLYNEYNTETLRIKAAEGNMGAVAELLNSNIKPNMACGAAAARGGHDEILSILLGFGMKADPDPMKHSETPMLAAIGRGHLKVIKLLLEQDNFDPTRRNREGKTYWEVAEERRGPKWQQERDMLKERYNEYRRQHQRSPKKSRARHVSPTRSQANSRENGRKPTASSEPPKARGRLVSAKELQQRELHSRELKRRRRVVADESDSESDDSDVRGPVKPVTKARTSSGVTRRDKPSSPEALEKPPRRESESGEHPRQAARAPQDDPAPDPDAMEDIKQETPEPIKTERLAEAERQAEAERLAAEKAAAEAQAAAEAERAKQAAEQARLAAEQAQREREERLQALPRALRRALQRGKNRPLHFDGEEMGISANFLPVHRVRLKEINPDCSASRQDELWMLSFQAVGILGLPEIDLREYPAWQRHQVSDQQRQRFLRGYDLAQLAQDFRFPMEGVPGFDPAAIERVMTETRAQFLKMPLEWVRWEDFETALRGGGYEHLRDLKVRTAEYIHVHDPAVVNGDVHKPRSFLDVILGSAAVQAGSHG